jgi:hypothetical protein
MGQMDSPDLGQQGAIGRFARAFGPAAPSIIARRRDAHHIAHDANRKRLALVLDETEFHFGASEKMRKVFFKISRSMRRRVKTPPIMTPPLNSPSVLISFEKMKFRRGHFRAKPDPLLARLLT